MVIRHSSLENREKGIVIKIAKPNVITNLFQSAIPVLLKNII
jgi:hypothetical protein